MSARDSSPHAVGLPANGLRRKTGCLELSYHRLMFQLPTCNEDSIYIIEAMRSYEGFVAKKRLVPEKAASDVCKSAPANGRMGEFHLLAEW